MEIDTKSDGSGGFYGGGSSGGGDAKMEVICEWCWQW
jgi:hypothetical protein